MKRAHLEARSVRPAADARRTAETPPPEPARQHEPALSQISWEIRNRESDGLRCDPYDLAPVGYVTLNEQGFILQANLTAGNLLGMSSSLLVWQPLIRFIASEDKEVFHLHRQQLDLSGRHQCELRFLQPYAPPVWVCLDSLLTPGREGAGSVYRVAMHDITARKSEMQALLASERKHRQLFESSSDAIMTLEGPSWLFTSGNAACMALFGTQTEKAFLSCTPWDLSPERQPDGRVSAEKAPEIIATALRNGSHFFEWQYRRIDGVEFAADVLLTRMERDGKATLQATVRDITARKKVQESNQILTAQLQEQSSMLILATSQLEESRVAALSLMQDAQKQEKRVTEALHEQRALADQLEAANQELESFSYSVSHDLRAPLRHVHGYVAMLKKVMEGRLSEKERNYLKVISDASVEMGQLIDDLLDFSRLGRTEMQETPVDLNQLVRQTLLGLEMETQGRNITWRIAPLPPALGDATMLKQVFANLIGNAVKYTRLRNPAEIELGSSGEEEGRCIYFVRDNGAGFDPKYAHKLFGVFQRLHRAEEYEGHGIGLALVRRILTRHGDRIWAESHVGAGATFHFTLKKPRVEQGINFRPPD